MRESVHKLFQLLNNPKPFFDASLEETLKFSSSLYSMSVWIRAAQVVIRYPRQMSAKALPENFESFVKDGTLTSYEEDIVSSFEKLNISSFVGTANKSKKRWMELLSSDDNEIPYKKVKVNEIIDSEESDSDEQKKKLQNKKSKQKRRKSNP